MRILVVGDINVDLILSGLHGTPGLGREVLVDDFSMVLGCAACITAAGLVKLGNEVSFVGKVGTDAGGEFCLGQMRELGLDVSRVIRGPGLKTGVAAVMSTPEDRGHITYLGAITALQEDEIRDECFQGVSHLHLSSFFLLESLRPDCRRLFRRAHEHGLTVSLDPCHDPASEWGPDLKEILAEVDVFLPNQVEITGITETPDPVEALKRLQNGRPLSVLKLGAEGALALGDSGPQRQTAPSLQPIDPTGAGDSFNAGFLHAWVRGRSLQEAMQLGVACGSYSTLGFGGTAHQPTYAQARDFCSQTMTSETGAFLQ